MNSNNTAAVSIRIEAITSQASKAVKQLFDSVSTRVKVFNELNAVAKSAGDTITQVAQAAAFAFSLNAMKGFVEEALKAERNMSVLRNTLRNSGQDTDDYRERLAAMREELARTAGISNDASTRAQTTLAQRGVSQSEMERYLKMAADLGTAMGGGIEEGAFALGQAISGDTIALRGFKLEIDSTLPKSQQIEQMFTLLAKKVGGEAVAAAQGASGSFKKLGVAVDELKEAIGKDIIDGGLLVWVRNITDSINKMTPEGRRAIEVFGGIAIAVGGLTLVTPLVASAFSTMAGAFSLILGYNVAQYFGLILSGSVPLGTAMTTLGLSASSLALKLAPLAAIAYGIAKGYQTAKAALEAYKAKQAEVDARNNLGDRSAVNAVALTKSLRTAVDSGVISENLFGFYITRIKRLSQEWREGKLSVEEYSTAITEITKHIRELSASPDQIKKSTEVKWTPEMKKAYLDGAYEVEKANIAFQVAEEKNLYDRRAIDSKKYLDLRAAHIKEEYELNLEYHQRQKQDLDAQLTTTQDPNNEKYKGNEADREKEIASIRTEMINENKDFMLMEDKHETELMELEQERFKIEMEHLEAKRQKEEQAFEAQVNALKIQASAIDADWRLTDVQRRQAAITDMKTQIALYDQEIARLKELASLVNPETEEGKKLNSRVMGLSQERGGIQASLDRKLNEPDPTSYTQQVEYQFNQLANTWGTQAQQMATILTSTVTSAVNGLSNALAGVIMGTQSAAQAFSQFAIQMATQFIASIIQMILIAQVAIPILTALGILSGGSTPAAGLAVTTASLAAGASMAGQYSAFSEGGRVPGVDSHRDNVFAMLATGEYVMKTRARQYYGTAVFDAINEMRIPRSDLEGWSGTVRRTSGFAYASGGMVGAASAPITVLPAPVNMAVVNNQSEFKDFMEKHGNAMAFDFAQKNKRKLGIPS